MQYGTYYGSFPELVGKNAKLEPHTPGYVKADFGDGQQRVMRESTFRPVVGFSAPPTSENTPG